METAKVCGFCHRGSEVSDVCGYLFAADNTLAHKKCMQYSAGLIQYHHNIGFGGFKLEKVTREMTRGNKLKCSLCSKLKKKSATIYKRASGATSGCAWPRCSKTFHFFCANTDEETITRRMEVVNKRKKSHKFVEYRVFCSQKHEESYIDSKTKEHQRVRHPSEESGSSGEDLDHTMPAVNASELDEEFETDSSGMDVDNGVSSTVRSDHKPSTSRRRSSRRPLDDLETDSEDSIPEIKKAKKSNRDHSTSSKRKNYKSSNSSSMEGNRSQEESTNGVTRAIGTLTPVDRRKGKDTSCLKTKKNLDFGGSKVVRKETDVNPIKIEINPLTDCLLCFVELEEVAPDLEKKLKRFINKVYHIPGSSVCTWSCPDFQLSSEHIVYLLKDLTMALRHQQYEEFQRLTSHLQADDINKYNYIIELNGGYPDDLSKTIYGKLRDSIKDNLRVASAHLHKLCGFYCRVQHKQNQIRVAFLALNDGTDPDEKIRKTLLKHVDLHQWDITTHVQISGLELTKETREAEHQVLRQWLSVLEGSFVDARPWDPVMVGDQRGSVTVRLLKHFQTSASYTDTSNRVIFIRPLDGSIIVYSSYLRKLLSGLFQEESEQSVVVLFDLQPDLECLSDILRGLPRNVTGKVMSAFNPSEQPVSCIALKLEKTSITDDTVSSTTAGKAAMEMVDEDLQEEADGADDHDDGIDMCEIIREDPPTEAIDFTPPDLKWRLLQCNSLGLKMTSICSPNTILETRTIGIPSLTHKIKGDGNCFFRALSQEITGTQNQHYQVRKKLIHYMTKRPQLFNKFFNMQDVKIYVQESEMCDDGIWATDTEIIAMATMLETNIVIFTKVGSCWKWLPYSPVDGSTSHDCQVYLVNKGHHYDLVLDVRAIKN